LVEAAVNDLDDLLAAKDADDVIDPGHLFKQGIALALGQAPGHDDGTDPALLLEVEHLADDGQGFLASGFDEAAGIDDDDVGAIGLGGEGVAGLRELAEHAFGIDEVLGAAKADKRETALHRLTHAKRTLPSNPGLVEGLLNIPVHPRILART